MNSFDKACNDFGSNTAQQGFDSTLEQINSKIPNLSTFTPEEHSSSMQIETCEKRDSDSGAEERKNAQSTFEASSDTKDDLRLIDSADQEDEETNSDQEDMVYAPNPF